MSKYVNTENKNDIVTLAEIESRYIAINGSNEGFKEYVSNNFNDGLGYSEYVIL